MRRERERRGIESVQGCGSLSAQRVSERVETTPLLMGGKAAISGPAYEPGSEHARSSLLTFKMRKRKNASTRALGNTEKRGRDKFAHQG